MFYTIEEGPLVRGLQHNPVNALVAPRPIGWVSTVDLLGRVNLAPFSYFNLVSADPPVVVFAPNDKDSQGVAKDSLRNVRETGEFVARGARVQSLSDRRFAAAPRRTPQSRSIWRGRGRTHRRHGHRGRHGEYIEDRADGQIGRVRIFGH